MEHVRLSVEAEQREQLARASGSQSPAERVLRERLGVPTAARQVLIFGESSHWDPNWLYTSDEYYTKRIQHILDEMIVELSREPRRVYSVECLFFLKLYWERRPEQRAALQRLVAAGQLRLTGTGMTTPDTLLPDTEAILRDYLIGQEWLREVELLAEPRVAYLPDDFGHSPLLPSLLNALGFDQACVTRIDGMYFIGADYRRKSAFPLAGSSAALLQRELRTLDFVWRSPDGAELLCHWNAFTYFQGDMLAHKGIIRWMGIAFGVPWRTVRHIARRIRGFARQLAPLSRTPYMFCPIGCDFNGPIPGLLELLDRHNEIYYPRTGIWAVNAGLDDYLALVDCHRAVLPVVALDPNPYWMGFYASRPQIKHLCNRISRKLQAAERLSALRQVAEHCCPPVVDAGELTVPRAAATAVADAAVAANQPEERDGQGATRAGWDLIVVCNHHDFITGTSPDRVFHEEQRPWLARAEAHADEALRRAFCRCCAPGARPRARPPEWQLKDGQLEVASPHFRLRLAAEAGGCLVSCRDVRGVELLEGPANDLVLYHDTGGLWRMGHEFRGGVFRERACTSARPARIGATERDGLLEVRVDAELDGRPLTRWLWLTADSPLLRLRVSGTAGARRTITCRFPTALRGSTLTMDVPGGVVTRPTHKLYSPTFWAARSFVHFRDEAPADAAGIADGAGRGLVAFLGGPASAGLTADGRLEWIALRNAPRERAFGFLPVLAHPASGTSPEEQTLDYAVWLTPAGDHLANAVPQRARRALEERPPPAAALEGIDPGDAIVLADSREVMVTAVKRASRGPGLIVRLQRLGPVACEVRLRCPVRAIHAGRRCDARERDLEGGEVRMEGGSAVVPLAGSITSVRLLFV